MISNYLASLDGLEERLQANLPTIARLARQRRMALIVDRYLINELADAFSQGIINIQ